MANFLTDFNQPTINSVQARLVLSNEILQNIGQNIIENDGQGVTQRFAKDARGGRINVIRVLPLTQEARVYGADYNGQPFATGDFEQPNTTQYGLDVITVIDKPIAIRNATKDMIPVDLLAAETKNFSLLVYRNINAMTIAGKIAKSLKTAQLKQVDLTGTSATAVRDAVIGANAKLDDGDASNGVDAFPTDDRICVIRPSLRPYLLSANNILVGGSNYAQDILAKGTLDQGSNRDFRNGYIGIVDGLPTYTASSAIWSLAEKYLGLPAGELDGVYGYISSGMANARGIALDETIKIVDATAGPGILIQPDCRLGFESFYEKGNVFLVKTSFVIPEVTLKLLAPGSRSKPTITLSAQTGTSFPTVTIVTATGRSIVSKQAVYDASTTAALTVVGFDTLYAAANANQKISDVTSGAAASATATVSSKYLFVKVIDDLGNATIVKSTGTFSVTV
ncbi:MAG: hypothetical protein EOM74_01065 [Methanomicrobia archaeon]|nr:hypothetical protein [Methanomicrobia archaeon]